MNFYTFLLFFGALIVTAASVGLMLARTLDVFIEISKLYRGAGKSKKFLFTGISLIDDLGNPIHQPICVDLDQIATIYPMADNPEKTCVMLKSGDSFVAMERFNTVCETLTGSSYEDVKAEALQQQTDGVINEVTRILKKP